MSLTPLQSIMIHGLYNPKRLLCWHDFCHDKDITTTLCHRCGIGADLLHIIQPSLPLWIENCKVSFCDVPHMTAWPLHPFDDLHGYIPDLIENKYDAALLHKLNIDYDRLVEKFMTVEWMKMFNFSPQDWALLGLDATKYAPPRAYTFG